MLNHERLKQRRAEDARGGRTWKPKEGTTSRIRVLPPHSRFLTAWEQMMDVGVPYEIHFFRVEGKQQIERSRCLKDFKQVCPACEAYWAHYKSADPGLQNLAKQVKSARVYLMNMLDIGNLQAGVQPWAANFSSWDQILELAADPSFGNIIDPANGVNVLVTVTPGKQTRNGFPFYEVKPERDGGPAGPVLRTTVMPILEAIPGWQAALDQLEGQITPAKSEAEILGLLAEMRFPGIAPAISAGAAPVATLVVPAAALAAPRVGPQPVPALAVPAPVALPPAVGVMIPGVTSQQQPAVVGAALPEPPGVAMPAAVTMGEVPHYDPGPTYVPKVPDGQRPTVTASGRPVPCCFGDYDPGRHRCQPCPAYADCQIKVMGISG